MCVCNSTGAHRPSHDTLTGTVSSSWLPSTAGVMCVWRWGFMHVFCRFLKDLRPGLNNITLLKPFLINICSSFLMPFHDSVSSVSYVTSFSLTFHHTAGFSSTVEHLWIFQQTLHLHPEAPWAQIISGWVWSTWRTLGVSRSTRWNVPPVYPAFSYYKPLPTNGFILWTTKLNIVDCVYVFRRLSSSLWSVETGSFL